MKTIKDAVIELGGKWPVDHNYLFYRNGSYFCAPYNESPTYQDKAICSKSEFESCAKRLGYINGYRWGVEYPTNGKRPDLADGVVIEPFYDDEWHHGMKCGTLDWRFDSNECDPVAAFRITDPRYKPADTSYLNASKAQSLTHSEEGLTHSEWWDYESNKRTSNPPIGEKLLLDDSGVMTESVILYIGKEKILATIADGSDTEYCMSVASLDFYYPLDHATRKAELEREKVIDAAFECLKKDGFDYDATKADYFEALYNAGMLVLPQNKSDTED